MAHHIEVENIRYHRILFLLLSTWHDSMAPIHPGISLESFDSMNKGGVADNDRECGIEF